MQQDDSTHPCAGSLGLGQRDQAGEPSGAGWETIFRTPEPSAFMTQMSAASGGPQVKAMRRPSGDHAGWRPPDLVIRSKPEPSACMT